MSHGSRESGAKGILRGDGRQPPATARTDGHVLDQYLRSILNNPNIWIDVIDSCGNVILWNVGAERISGYTSEEVIGHDRIWEWQYPNPAYRRRVRSEVRRILEQAEPDENLQTTIRSKDGESRIIGWNTQTLTDAEGRPTGAIAIGRDITEQVRTREDLKHINEMQQRAVAIVAHEARTPLTAIKGYADLLRAGHCGASSERQRELLGRISQNAERLAALVESFLTLDKIEARTRRRNTATFSLALVLRDVAEAHHATAEERGLRISTDVQGPLLVPGDSDQLAEVFANLVSNAIKFSVSGDIRIAGRSRGDHVLVEVSDQGCGIPSREHSAIFEKFYQGSNPPPGDSRRGTGLGLSIAMAIVREHDGAITVDSQVDVGSTFSVTLPAGGAARD